MIRRNKKTNKKKRTILIVAIVCVLLAAGAFAFIQQRNNSPAKDSNNSDSTKQDINLAPPTEDEQAAADNQKEQNIDTGNTPRPGASPNTASVVIVDVNQYDGQMEARAFVSNRIESGGQCTFTFVMGNAKVTKTSAAEADASTTQCQAISFPTSELSKGTWAVTIAYKSQAASGEASTSVEVK